MLKMQNNGQWSGYKSFNENITCSLDVSVLCSHMNWTAGELNKFSAGYWKLTFIINTVNKVTIINNLEMFGKQHYRHDVN